VPIRDCTLQATLAGKTMLGTGTSRGMIFAPNTQAFGVHTQELNNAHFGAMSDKSNATRDGTCFLA
jgi:hypothetical protein